MWEKYEVEMEIMWTVNVWPKGQIVIPKNLRNKLGIEPWDNMVILLKWGKYIWLVRNDDMVWIREFLSSLKK